MPCAMHHRWSHLLFVVLLVIGFGACSSRDPELLESLSSPEEPVRYRAVLEISKAGSSLSNQSLDGLRARLDDPSPRIRIAAARGLSSAAAGEGVVSELARLLEDERPEVRRVAIEGLVRNGDGAVIDVILDRLLDRDPEIRELTRQALVELGVSGRDQIARQADRRRNAIAKQAKSAEWSRRLQVARDLATCGDDEALDVLLEMVDDSEPDVARAAGFGLGRAFHNASNQDLWNVLDVSPPDVAEKVLAGMTHAPSRGELDQRTSAKLCTCLSDEHTGRIAAQVIAAHQIRCDLSPLVRRFEESDGAAELDAAITIALLAKAPETPHPLILRAATLIWRSARGVDLATVVTLGDRISDSADARVNQEMERYLSSSERWIQAPSTEGETGADDTDQDTSDPTDLSGGEALRALLSRYPSRQLGWIELFPFEGDVGDLVTMLIVSGELGIEIDDELVDALVRSAPDAHVRAAAVWAHDSGEQFLQSESPQIRAVAAESLRRRADEIDGPIKARLSFILADHDPSVRAAAAATLAATGDPAAFRPLLAALRRWHDPAVVRALGDLGQHDAAEAISELLSDAAYRSNSELIVALLDALTLVGSQENTESIAPFVSDPRPQVRRSAVRAARAIGGTRLSQLADERRADFALIVREAASLTF